MRQKREHLRLRAHESVPQGCSGVCAWARALSTPHRLLIPPGAAAQTPPSAASPADITHGSLLFAADGPDTPLISPSDTYFPTGDNLSLWCHAASNPPAQYSWLVAGKPLAHSQELLLPHLTTNNSGAYTCFAHNAVTGLNRTAVTNITVLGKRSREHSTGLEGRCGTNGCIAHAYGNRRSSILLHRCYSPFPSL